MVSRTDGALSGFLWAHILDNPGNQRPKMLLYSIDVFPEFRRKGIAGMLIREIKQIARNSLCREMWVPTGKTNLAAVALYRTTGGVSRPDDDITFTYDLENLDT
jgi:ribosomal protein S18 acetylase RimI-like enzyme